MKILITGGAGFIGSHLVDRLADKHEVVVLDNLDPQVHIKGIQGVYINEVVEYHFGDICNRATLETAMEGVEIIFHEAASVGVSQSMSEITKYVGTNSYGTAQLLNLLVNNDNQVKKLIVASSNSIYGEGAYECLSCGIVNHPGRPEKQLRKRQWEVQCSCGKPASPALTSESSEIKPRSIYAITKRDQEEMCMTIGKSYDIPTVALRYFNTYGPRQSLNNPYTGVCAIFSSRLKENRAPIIFEDGGQKRDFICVDDVVRANVLAMESSHSNYEVFNVGTSVATTIKDVASVLAESHNKNIEPTVTQSYRLGDTRHCLANISKIKRKLGFCPTKSFSEGMKELVLWSCDAT